MSAPEGLDLDENADITIDSAGDVSRVTGMDVIETDLAYKLARDLDGFSITTLDRTTQSELQTVIRSTILDDHRVQAINDLTIRRSENRSVPIASVDDVGLDIDLDVILENGVLNTTIQL